MLQGGATNGSRQISIFEVNAIGVSLAADNGGRLNLGHRDSIMLSGSGEGHFEDGNISFGAEGNLSIDGEFVAKNQASECCGEVESVEGKDVISIDSVYIFQFPASL